MVNCTVSFVVCRAAMQLFTLFKAELCNFIASNVTKNYDSF